MLPDLDWLHDLKSVRTDAFAKFVAKRLFNTGFIVIRWILGCDLPMHKSGLGQNEAGVLL